MNAIVSLVPAVGSAGGPAPFDDVHAGSQPMGPMITTLQAVQIAGTRDGLHSDPRFGAGQDVLDTPMLQIDRIDRSGWQ